ncbi:hypothetical protein J3Q64DRAFT_1007854 [Phycomyces blakesleeanus]|uniref:Inhibitor of growth protein N-terminal histone-binding domain-containing protein n=2 Tax=Phycomyces blakesleeanus TaxID=4837 RepID=A0A163B1S0_PHYB8|nr:hypothetical protein PHYBLDRAFT_164709 [Phycomyces blakesleeanus NRRL 1555(-)]OAD77821.1 hypothetical protein PHYBLDRAFT_164709 [Phycomyces blakesleeanus NRRL 1555(-)]|eukprot:XP_018295861.1 hypothetical protein PHYBLDRAFT_164709 [Phycomyces blakesleeanus NRRL 1555(-)]
MQLDQLEKALRQLPHDTLMTEIPEIQNSIAHLKKSNDEMREYDPDHSDPDFVQAIGENIALIKHYEERIDLTLRVIREIIGEAAAREMGSNVASFRERYQTPQESTQEEAGVFL